jgi:outer membrane lipoprotein SlyB
MNDSATMSSATALRNPASSNKPLWATVGVLSAAVLAMGGTMLYSQGVQRGAAASAVPVAALAPALQTAPKSAAPQASNSVADDLIEAPARPAVKKAATVKAAPRPAPAPRYAGAVPATYPAANYPAATYPQAPPAGSYPAAYPQAPVCASCGSVESVTAVQRAVKPTSPISIGSVAGGVIGAALGNQVGHGNGRALATVIGAVGGGYAGHTIEGHVRKETVYQVGVRMEDGSRRTIESATAPAVGSRITVDGNSLQGAGYERRAATIPVTYSQSAN